MMQGDQVRLKEGKTESSSETGLSNTEWELFCKSEHVAVIRFTCAAFVRFVPHHLPLAILAPSSEASEPKFD